MRLRKQTFFSLTSLNQAIKSLLDDVNHRPFKQRPGSRLSQFEALDKPALQPLPSTAYVYQTIKKARVPLDYHVQYEGHYYSVPYQLLKKEVMIYASDALLRVFHQGKQVAAHPRSHQQGQQTTDNQHMAKAHRKHHTWSPDRLLAWAVQIGPCTQTVAQYQLDKRCHPEHGYRTCLGLIKLSKQYSKDRLEAACQRARSIGGMNYKSIASILSKSLDKVPLEGATPEISVLPQAHDNVRGAHYYH